MEITGNLQNIFFENFVSENKTAFYFLPLRKMFRKRNFLSFSLRQQNFPSRFYNQSSVAVVFSSTCKELEFSLNYNSFIRRNLSRTKGTTLI